MTLIAFDLLRLDGEDLCARPLAERREAARSARAGRRCLAGAPDVRRRARCCYAAAEQQGLEGIVSKRLSSRYRPGQRSRDWLKFPIRPTGSYVVGGFRHETGSTNRLGAVLVGQPTEHGLEFRGRVGSGIAGKAGPLLAELLMPLVVADSPFTQVLPRLDRVGTVWVEPSWSWTCSTSGSPPTAGSGSRRTAASAPTCRPRT